MRLILAISAFSVVFAPVFCENVEKVVTSSGFTDGLLWDQRTQKLIFENTCSHKLCSLNPLTLEVFCARIGNGLVSYAVPVQNTDSQFVVAATNDILLVTWDGEQNVENPPTRLLTSVEKNIEGSRLNYGGVDPFSGKLWIGTYNIINGVFRLNEASLYSLDSNLKLEKQISPVSFSSGLVWNFNDSKLYYDDILTYQVASYDYNLQLGTVENRQVVFDLKKNNVTGWAGRLTIDTDGNLWVPLYEASSVIKIDPKSGQLLQTVEIPAKRVGAVTFGGPELDVLYVSTMGYGFINPAEKTPLNDQEGGSIFAVKGLGVKGLPTISFKLNA